MAPFSPTKSMIASAPSAVGQLPHRVALRAVDLDGVVARRVSLASASAFSDGSMTMISVGV